MSRYFKLSEFTRSDTAARKGIDNALPDSLLLAGLDTLDMLERIRGRLSLLAGRDVPVNISSGYRCPTLNSIIGSNPNSDHPKASAADFTAPAFGSPLEICKTLAPMVDELRIGQLIHEFSAWVHVSTRYPMLPINRILTISRAGTVPGIKEV
jgi:zinc D-Ala-D-Ala carboxypeptidase